MKWTISSEPSGAAVFNEQGTMLGNTPWKAELTPKAGTRQLRLRREGYADSIIDLDESSDSQLTVRMVRLSAGKPALTKLRPTPGNPQPAHPKTDKRPELSYED
ncbi:MAG: PEGA domain-containing protein [Candidatus Hydrogenedentes bacterium]|nr:PEGA domain-containing protein [Candidatus Hydrogenedentota bacterium]